MIFKYDGKTFTGSRQEIIESLTQFLKESSLEYCSEGDFSLCEESVHLHAKQYILDSVKNSLIKKAIAKVPKHEIAIHTHTLLNYLLIDGEQIASQSKWFTFNQILIHSGIGNLMTTFDIKVEIKELINGQHALYFNDLLVAHKDNPFTIYELIHRVSTF